MRCGDVESGDRVQTTLICDTNLERSISDQIGFLC